MKTVFKAQDTSRNTRFMITRESDGAYYLITNNGVSQLCVNIPIDNLISMIHAVKKDLINQIG